MRLRALPDDRSAGIWLARSAQALIGTTKMQLDDLAMGDIEIRGVTLRLV